MERHCFVLEAECSSGRTRGGWVFPYVPPSLPLTSSQYRGLMTGLRVTEDTELGDNETIKVPPKLPTTPFPNRNRRRRRTAASIEAEAKAEAKAQAETPSS